MRATAHAVFYPWGLTRLAEAYGQAEQPAAALRVVAEALTVVDRTEERRLGAELYRLKGRCWAPKPPPTKRERLPAASKPDPGSCAPP
jgi:hypothetical protein